MRKLYFGLLATVAVGLTHTGRGAAQNPPPAVLPDGLPTAVPADPLTVTQPPAPQPGAPGAFDALQGITGCAPAEPPTPPRHRPTAGRSWSARSYSVVGSARGSACAITA